MAHIFVYMKDIAERRDIEEIVGRFYQKALADDLIKHFFLDIAAIDITTHLPVICNFWESILLGTNRYKDNAMLKHISLSKKSKLEKKHFDRWLSLWKSTIDSNYRGPLSDLAKERAHQIASLMLYKISAPF